MRTAGGIARDILLEAAAQVKPGVTTGEIDAYVAECIRERDCVSAFLGYQQKSGGVPFPGNICISVNEEIVHGIGGARKIQPGDVIKIDVGVHKAGWVGDNALTVPVGNVGLEIERLLRTTEEALHIAIDFARDGVMLADAGRSHREEVESLSADTDAELDRVDRAPLTDDLFEVFELCRGLEVELRSVARSAQPPCVELRHQCTELGCPGLAGGGFK